VIDYYHLPDDEHGNPVFSLDVRPALDNWISFKLRLDAWQKTAAERWFKTEAIPQQS
jgi:cytochrome c heme-lyase